MKRDGIIVSFKLFCILLKNDYCPCKKKKDYFPLISCYVISIEQ
jgi:hypothetical protein